MNIYIYTKGQGVCVDQEYLCISMGARASIIVLIGKVYEFGSRLCTNKREGLIKRIGNEINEAGRAN
jgi:hypothetical protein